MADFERLKRAIDWSQQQLQRPREQRVDSIRQFVGKHYFQGGADRVVPVNMIELAVSIYVRSLAARAPRVLVSTTVDELKPQAYNMQLALNQIPREIGLACTLRKAVMEAMFGIGVVKVGLEASGRTVDGADAGEPFVDLVTLDDYFVDMSAKSRDGIQFEGNDYWLPIEAARDLSDVALEPDDHTTTGSQGESRAEGIQVNEGADVYGDRVLLRDVWLPDTWEMLTYSVTSGKLLRKIKWDGPESGPYHILGYSDVPGNVMPLPPVSLWRDLHDLANNLFRKLGKQGTGKKSVVAFGGGNPDDVEALKKTSDGEGFRYNGPKPEQLTIGGIDQETFALFLQTKDLFSYQAGNLDALGGLGPMSDTASQDEMIGAAASTRQRQMKATTIAFDRGIFEALAWYEWTDPIRVRYIEKPVEGTDIVLRSEWSAETRDGDWLDYNFDIDPFSVEDDSPELRLQKIRQVFSEFVMPLMPLLQAQGVQIDFRSLVELLAKYSNLDELRSLFTFQEPIQGDPQQAGDKAQPMFKPAETKRTYERVNRPGATRSGKEAALSQILMGGKPQGAEAASIGRPTS